MSYEHWLKLFFVLAFVLWLGANLVFFPAYIRAFWRAKRSLFRAPFVFSALWFGVSNALSMGYWMWLLFWTPTNPDVVKWAVLVIPFDYSTGAIAYILFNAIAIRSGDA